MPPKKNPEADADAPATQYTETDIKLMAALLETMEKSYINYDALAERLGSATAAAARTRTHRAFNKHPTWFTGAGAAKNEDGTPVKKARAKPGPKKKKAPSDEEDDNAEEQANPLKKKARTVKAKAGENVKKEDADAVEGEA